MSIFTLRFSCSILCANFLAWSESQNGGAGPSTLTGSVPPISGFGEIFQLVELKDGEPPLLAQALKTCDIALEYVKKEKVEAKERLKAIQQQLEMAQSKFEAIDDQLMGLLEHRKKLVTRMAEFQEIVSAKGRPFGF